MTNEENKDDEARVVLKEKVLPIIAIIISALALIVSLFGILDRAYGATWIFSWLSKNDQFFINIGNIGASVLGLYYIVRTKPPEYKITNAEKFKSLAEVDYEGNDLEIYISNVENKVSELVGQFRAHIILFAISLCGLYTVILINPDANRVINFFSISTNLLNLSGGVFIYLVFSVLHKKTVEEDREKSKIFNNLNKQSKISYVFHSSTYYWATPVTFAFIYLLVFLSYSFSSNDNSTEFFLNRIDLVSGFAVGMAMTLLFGRYVSIEQSLKDTNLFENVFENFFHPFSKKSYKGIVSFGITFVLPIYALAQPLFGALTIEAFGVIKNFQTTIYLVCLIGKICFLQMTYLLISTNLMHLYLYGVVSHIGNFKELEKYLGLKR
jgi:hypothetical protein